MGNRIGIFIYGYGLGNSPSLINTGNALADAGFEVDYFTCRTFIGGVKFNNPKITLHDFEEEKKITASKHLNFIKNVLPLSVIDYLSKIYCQLKPALEKIFYSRELVKGESTILGEVGRYIRKAEEVIGDRRYKCLIGAEPGGLIAVGTIGQKKGIPYIYYNLELHLSAEGRTIEERVFKKYERIYNKSAAFTITQDEERARLLAEDNEVSFDDVVMVPVCADGPRFEKRSNYLREKFNLSDDDKIILYAGFISDWAMCEELAKAALSWPDNWVLILHSHGYNDEGYIRKIKRYEGVKVKVSLEPVPYDDLPSFLASADIGVALYRDIGKNFTAIGSASGKLAHYLKSGLPVITNDYPSIKKIIDFYRCGVCIGGLTNISAAIEEIANNYDSMHSNAYRCYEERYMFSRNFKEVVGRIKKL